jgi:hypothetical protein
VAKQQQGKKFTANVKVTVIVGVELSGKTLEDALVQARQLKPDNCISVDGGENVDWTYDLIGVSSDEWINY